MAVQDRPFGQKSGSLDELIRKIEKRLKELSKPPELNMPKHEPLDCNQVVFSEEHVGGGSGGERKDWKPKNVEEESGGNEEVVGDTMWFPSKGMGGDGREFRKRSRRPVPPKRNGRKVRERAKKQL